MEKKPTTSLALEENGAAEEQPLRLLRLPKVLEMTDFPESTLRGLIRRGKFPRPVKCGPRYAAWPLHEVQAWIASKLAERDAREAQAPGRGPETKGEG
jgi:prophage regulatory protein